MKKLILLIMAAGLAHAAYTMETQKLPKLPNFQKSGHNLRSSISRFDVQGVNRSLKKIEYYGDLLKNATGDGTGKSKKTNFKEFVNDSVEQANEKVQQVKTHTSGSYKGNQLAKSILPGVILAGTCWLFKATIESGSYSVAQLLACTLLCPSVLCSGFTLYRNVKNFSNASEIVDERKKNTKQIAQELQKFKASMNDLD